jgi:hypothetical protein
MFQCSPPAGLRFSGMDRHSAEREVVCVPNIGAAGIRRRTRNGVGGGIMALAAFAWLAAHHASAAAFLLVAPLTGYSAICFLQARGKT